MKARDMGIAFELIKILKSEIFTRDEVRLHDEKVWVNFRKSKITSIYMKI